MKSAPRILLVSNSTVYGRGYLDHVEQETKAFLGKVKRILFFPYALYQECKERTSNTRKSADAPSLFEIASMIR